MKHLMKLIMTSLLLLGSFLAAPAYAWPEVDTMNMCNQPVQAVRAYQGGAKSWANRDAATQNRRYYAANCPNVKAPVKSYNKPKKHYKKKVYRKKAKSKTCANCYKKGFRDGYRAAKKNKHYSKAKHKRKFYSKKTASGYRNHAEELADCKRVDNANYASRTRVVARW